MKKPNLATRTRLVRAMALLSSVLLLGTVAGSAYFWGLVAFPERAGLLAELKVLKSVAPGPHDPPPLQDLKARLAQEEARIATLESRIPASVSTLSMTDAIFQAARQAGVAVEGVSFGGVGPSPIQGFQEAAASATILAPNPLATVRFLEAVSHGSLPATASLGSLSLLPGPQTVTVTVEFFERESGG